MQVPFWHNIIRTHGVNSVLDVGCAGGWNQRAIKVVSDAGGFVRTAGVDINEGALATAREDGHDVYWCKAENVGWQFGNRAFDLVVTSGVLIHVAPEHLGETMRAIYDVANRFVLAIEYPAIREEHVEYRGEHGLLWKRPYGELYQDLGLTLVDQGEAVGFDRCWFYLLRKGAA